MGSDLKGVTVSIFLYHHLPHFDRCTEGHNCDLPRSDVLQLQPLSSLQRLSAQGTDHLVISLAEEERRKDDTAMCKCGSRQGNVAQWPPVNDDYGSHICTSSLSQLLQALGSHIRNSNKIHSLHIPCASKHASQTIAQYEVHHSLQSYYNAPCLLCWSSR